MRLQAAAGIDSFNDASQLVSFEDRFLPTSTFGELFNLVELCQTT
jgi:hypothetical protein